MEKKQQSVRQGTICNAFGAFHFLSSFIELTPLWSYITEHFFDLFFKTYNKG